MAGFRRLYGSVKLPNKLAIACDWRDGRGNSSMDLRNHGYTAQWMNGIMENDLCLENEGGKMIFCRINCASFYFCSYLDFFLCFPISHSSNCFLEMPRVLRLLLTTLSGTGSICVCNVIGRFNPSLVHNSWPPLPLVPFSNREHPFSNRNSLKSLSGMLDILTVFMQI